MTYEQKNSELQKILKEKFDACNEYKSDPSSLKYEVAKSEYEKANLDLQQFLILFQDNNASPDGEFGTEGERCA